QWTLHIGREATWQYLRDNNHCQSQCREVKGNHCILMIDTPARYMMHEAVLLIFCGFEFHKSTFCGGCCINALLCHFDRSEERAKWRNLAVRNDKISRLKNLLQQIFPLEMTHKTIHANYIFISCISMSG